MLTVAGMIARTEPVKFASVYLYQYKASLLTVSTAHVHKLAQEYKHLTDLIETPSGGYGDQLNIRLN